MTSTPSENRLADSTSPYLRQHAANPVDWYTWGPEAFERARREDKPILLSVGYSACHWCHVMAHESFEDAQTAALMNERFINIKVDREERPDLDAIYQKVVQMMGEGGGWPLTVFLTPDQRPFYGGTYFPPEQKYGRPSFGHVLRVLSDLYRNDRKQIEEQAQQFMDGLSSIASMLERQSDQAVDAPSIEQPAALAAAGQSLLERVDDEWGGFGRAPKFPNPTALEILLVLARGEPTDRVAQSARTAVANTLVAMYQGGIYDHLRGGFARYAVDRVWLTPHFEKMLYDNAQLIALYAEASALWPDHASFRKVVADTIGYLVADMRSEEGLFYSATDADSEGEEGKYFVWTPAEIEDAIGPEDARVLCKVYGVTEQGNFEHAHSILHLPKTLGEVAGELGMELSELIRLLDRGRAKLLERRYHRVPPLRDDKILTAWNALLISGLVRAACVEESWGDTDATAHWTELACTAAQALLDRHVEGILEGDPAHGRVLRASFRGRVHTRGYLDDVAYLGRACLDLHELTLEPKWREAALALAWHGLAQYAREDGAGFYLTAQDAETLIERTEDQHDGPVPSGAGVILELLLRLEADGVLPEARPITQKVIARFTAALAQPMAYASVLTAATHASPDATHVTIRGPAPSDAGVRALASIVRTARLTEPHAVTLSFEPGPRAEAIACRNQVCKAPISDPTELAAEIG